MRAVGGGVTGSGCITGFLKRQQYDIVSPRLNPRMPHSSRRLTVLSLPAVVILSEELRSRWVTVI